VKTDEYVLERLGQEDASASAKQTKRWLENSDLKPVGRGPASVTVKEALRLWRTRLRNIEFTKKPINGLPELIRGLESLAPQRKVDQFGFTGSTSVATLFFDRQKGQYIGSAVVERRK